MFCALQNCTSFHFVDHPLCKSMCITIITTAIVLINNYSPQFRWPVVDLSCYHWGMWIVVLAHYNNEIINCKEMIFTHLYQLWLQYFLAKILCELLRGHNKGHLDFERAIRAQLWFCLKFNSTPNIYKYQECVKSMPLK